MRPLRRLVPTRGPVPLPAARPAMVRVHARLAALSSVAGLVIVVAACGTPPPVVPAPPLPVLSAVPPEAAEAVAATDAFGLDLLTAPTLAERTNLVVSPFGAATALRMVGAGAAGETAAQMARVLHLPDVLRAYLPPVAEHLMVSNTAWTQHGLTLNHLFRAALRNSYDTTHQEADFRGDPERARQVINRTVADQTVGRVPELFPPGTISSASRLVVTNAVYLKAVWARPFPAGRTEDAPFTRADGTTVRVPMMHNDVAVELGYAEGPGYQAVTLPCRGGGLAFTVIVPATTDVVRATGVAAILGEIRPASVALALPRFTVTSAMDLRETLVAAGMPAAFSPAEADFSGITDDEPLHLASVRHETFVRIDEEGVEAAAASGGDVRGVVSATEPHAVTVDRPFLFVVTDTATGAPLFLGRMGDPTVP